MARIAILSIATIAALALAGCAPTASDDDGRLRVVASTNVYGSIAESIGGELVSVTSIITSAAQDPHSYEASAQDQLAISKADLVIENGGGYDPFIDTLLEAASTDAVVLSASEASGLLEADHDHEAADHDAADHDHEGHDHIEGFNEHVWYSLHGIEHVAEERAHQLGELDPDNAAAFDANLDAFAAELEQLEATVAETSVDGLPVAITEPVPLYLLEAFGLENTTPEEFSEAIEEGTDVAPSVLNETLGTVGDASLLAYNSQTASAETERVRVTAEKAGVPVVEFSETMPDGEDYISWMTANVSAIAAALQ